MGKNRKERENYITEEDKKLLTMAKLRNSELYREQLKYERNFAIKHNTIRIAQLYREIEFKRKQIAETKSLEVHEGFLDRTKPLFMLENDIEQIQLEIEKLEDSNKKLKAEFEKSEQNVQ